MAASEWFNDREHFIAGRSCSEISQDCLIYYKHNQYAVQ